MCVAFQESDAVIVSVAIRRTNIGQDSGQPSLLDYVSPQDFTYLPNTAGCYSADDAVRLARLARELLDGHPLVKLEIFGSPTNLYPNMPETLKAADRKSTRLNSSHVANSYAVYCLKKKKECRNT